jgi:hypothetical protein
MTQPQGPNMIIGACEWVALPELGITKMRARVDTGAKSCALHATDIQTFVRDDQDWVRFHVHLGFPEPDRTRHCECRLLGTRSVRSTSGQSEQRLSIRTPIVIGHSSWHVDVTLSNRKRMRYRMLLGRLAMKDHCLVYPAQTFLQGRPRLD